MHRPKGEDWELVGCARNLGYQSWNTDFLAPYPLFSTGITAPAPPLYWNVPGQPRVGLKAQALCSVGLGFQHNSITYKLSDLGQITQPLWASFFHLQNEILTVSIQRVGTRIKSDGSCKVFDAVCGQTRLLIIIQVEVAFNFLNKHFSWNHHVFPCPDFPKENNMLYRQIQNHSQQCVKNYQLSFLMS